MAADAVSDQLDAFLDVLTSRMGPWQDLMTPRL